MKTSIATVSISGNSVRRWRQSRPPLRERGNFRNSFLTFYGTPTEVGAKVRDHVAELLDQRDLEFDRDRLPALAGEPDGPGAPRRAGVGHRRAGLPNRVRVRGVEFVEFAANKEEAGELGLEVREQGAWL